jgi:hypothetical protein
MRHRAVLAGIVIAAVTTLSACGGHPSTTGTSQTGGAGGGKSSSPATGAPATEFNPPGDIPDNQVYVAYTAPGGAVRLKVPEGWGRTTHGRTTTFSDKLNSIAIAVKPSPTGPTVASARQEGTTMSSTTRTFKLTAIRSIRKPAGTAVELLYTVDSPVNTVTGKVVRNAVERFEFWRSGTLATLTFTGPANADNVDPWRLVSDSLRWR